MQVEFINNFQVIIRQYFSIGLTSPKYLLIVKMYNINIIELMFYNISKLDMLGQKNNSLKL